MLFYISLVSCVQLNKLGNFFSFPFLPLLFLSLPSFFSSSKSFESISCPTNAVYPLGYETSALSSHWLLELFLHTLSLRLIFFFLSFFKDTVEKLNCWQTRYENVRLFIMCPQEWAGAVSSFPAFTDEACGCSLLLI